MRQISKKRNKYNLHTTFTNVVKNCSTQQFQTGTIIKFFRRLFLLTNKYHSRLRKDNFHYDTSWFPRYPTRVGVVLWQRVQWQRVFTWGLLNGKILIQYILANTFIFSTYEVAKKLCCSIFEGTITRQRYDNNATKQQQHKRMRTMWQNNNATKQQHDDNTTKRYAKLWDEKWSSRAST